MNKQEQFDYYYNYLKDYLDEVGNRIVGFDSSKITDAFIRERAEYAVSVCKAEQEAGTIAPNEVALHVLMEGLTELEPTDDEKKEEEKYQKERAKFGDLIR